MKVKNDFNHFWSILGLLIHRDMYFFHANIFQDTII
jgi:hypothetical protein